MKVLDLFSGIGGFSLGLEKAGHETLAFCEIEPFPQEILKQWWPNKMIFKDIVKLNAYLRKALTSLPADFPAKTSALLAKKQGYSIANPPAQPQPVQDSSGRFYKPFAWYDLNTGLWRTWRQFTGASWDEYSERWPKAGMMLNGIAYRREGLEGGICGKDSTPLPTPVASDYKGASSGCKKIKTKEISMLRYFLHYHYAKPHQYTTYPNPTLLEKMMGYPIGHTVLKPLETVLTQNTQKI
ncbi:MAG: DNA cytosine methyltransferase [Patescibacteria group bacterium]|nr:DNA cytosine methyltransferase [Patescibacteria group bacterium]